MAEERVQRRLAAIVATDVVGYSRLMGEDEEDTLATLTHHHNELIGPCIAEDRGRLVKTTGDGLLVECARVARFVRYPIKLHGGGSTNDGAVPSSPVSGDNIKRAADRCPGRHRQGVIC